MQLVVHTMCILSSVVANANVHPQPLLRAKRFCDWQHSLFILICEAQQQVLSEANSKVVEAERVLLLLVVHTMFTMSFALANANVHPQPLVRARHFFLLAA